MDTRRLEIFLKLLETRSFSKTAAALGLTQPSVSASLKALEEAMGQKLFERTPRSVKPLAAAQTLQPYAAEIVETVGRAAWAMGHQLAAKNEKLTIGASSVPTVAFLPDILAVYAEKYPNVVVQIKGGQSRTILSRVADGELDVGLVGSPPDTKELSATVIGQDHLVLLASKQLARKVGPPPKTMEDLLNWPLILREDGSGTRAALFKAMGENAMALGSRLNVRAEVEGLAPLLALTRVSLGAAVVSSLIPPMMSLDGLTVAGLEFLGHRRFHLVRRRSARVSPALEALIALLKGLAPPKARA